MSYGKQKERNGQKREHGGKVEQIRREMIKNDKNLTKNEPP